MRKTDRILYEKGMTAANKYIYNKKKLKLKEVGGCDEGKGIRTSF